MYERFYRHISKPFRSKRARALLQSCNTGLVILVAGIYVATLLWLMFTKSTFTLKAILVPAIIFLTTTLLRALLDWKRPYETYTLDPLLPPTTKGKSFPSRHMASATAIACMTSWACPQIALAAWVMVCGVAFTRIIGGVHTPLDIGAGLLLALILSIVGYCLI